MRNNLLWLWNASALTLELGVSGNSVCKVSHHAAAISRLGGEEGHLFFPWPLRAVLAPSS